MTVPRIFGGGRRRLFLWLAVNGICQAAVAVALALLLSTGFASGTSIAALPGTVIAGLLAGGATIMALRTLERAQAEQLGQHYVTACRSRLFRAISQLPPRGGPQFRFGIMMTRMITDLTSMKNWVARGVAKITVGGFSISGAIVALAIVSPPLAAVTGAVLLALMFIGAVTSIAFRARVREARRLRGRLAANVAELTRAPGLMRHFGRVPRELSRLRGQSRAMSKALVRRSVLAGLMRSLSETVMPATLAVAAFAAAFSSGLGRLTIAELATAFFLIGLASGPLRDLMLALEYRASFRVGRRNLKAAFAKLKLPKVDPAPAAEEKTGPAALALDGAAFSGFPEPLRASVAPGERVLLMGPSGSGKSRLLHAVAGLSMADADETNAGIALDGQDIRMLPAELWQRRVKLVSADLPLLRSSLSRNIRYGAPNLDERTVCETLTRCGIDPDSAYFPEGLKTRLEEGGRNLPAGIRSRIALARAVATRPAVLLIDDPVFLIDEECQEALRTVVSDRSMTLIVAAPSAAEFVQWDQIWRLRNRRLLTSVPGRSEESSEFASNGRSI